MCHSILETTALSGVTSVHICVCLYFGFVPACVCTCMYTHTHSHTHIQQCSYTLYTHKYTHTHTHCHQVRGGACRISVPHVDCTRRVADTSVAMDLLAGTKTHTFA
jgi:hypothetical protein